MAKKRDREGLSSPDTGKGLADGSEVIDRDEPIVPPDMEAQVDSDDGLGDDIEGGAVPDTGLPDQADALEGLLREKGLKSQEDVVALVKNLERKITELGQENRTMRVSTMFPHPGAVQPVVQTERKRLEIPEDPSELFTDREKFGHFVQHVQDVSTSNARADLEQENAKAEYLRLYQQALEKASKNPEEFERLRGRMLRLSNTPAYARAGLDDIYKKAQEEELEEKKRQVEDLKKELFGDVDLDQLKALLPRARSGQISTAGGAGGSAGIPTTREEIEEDIRKRILGAKLG